MKAPAKPNRYHVDADQDRKTIRLMRDRRVIATSVHKEMRKVFAAYVEELNREAEQER